MSKVPLKKQTKTKTSEKKKWVTPRIEKIAVRGGETLYHFEDSLYYPES